jgi:hypothetical protein
MKKGMIKVSVLYPNGNDKTNYTKQKPKFLP